MGGFASQFNKYALGYAVAKKLNTELVLDISDYFKGYFRPYCLCDLKLPNYKIIKEREIKKIYPGIIEIKNSEDMEKMLTDSGKKDYWINREEKDYAECIEKNKELKLSEESEVLHFLAFRQDINCDFYKKFQSEMDRERAVAVHIRRGDFVALGWNEDMNYYKEAIAYMFKMVEDVHFYFFSNDLEWVSNYFGKHENYSYISSPKGNLGDMEEFFCMAYCKYRILSKRSSYGVLANILSVALYEDGYALINGSESGRITEARNGFRYLDETKICKSDGNIPIAGDEANVPIKVMSESRQRQIDEYQKNGQWKDIRECLESIKWQNVFEESKLWSRIYSLPQGNKDIRILTGERKNRWRIEGFYLLALILGRLGNKVEYLNWNEELNRDELLPGQACNIDGKAFPFTVRFINKKSIARQHKVDIIITDMIECFKWDKASECRTVYIENQKEKWKRCLLYGRAENLQRKRIKILEYPIESYPIENSDEIKEPYDIMRWKEQSWLEIVPDILETNGEKDVE